MTPGSEAIINKIHETTAKKGKPGLDRMNKLLELLGNPEKDFKVFHVGGTNGKGSTVRYLASILHEAGYSTGVYTSPHVMEYNERFEVDGEYISDEDFTRLGEKVLSYNEVLNDLGYGYPSEFEILTSIAYLFFNEQNPDYVILEVGLGGVIDSTNTIPKPVACIITQIGYDHVEILGDSLSEIAWNKAGIIKPGVPVISESPETEVVQVIRDYANDKNAPFIDSSSFYYDIVDMSNGVVFDAEILGREYSSLIASMAGEHQVRNAIAAITAIIVAANAGDVTVTENQIRQGLTKAHVMGRFEILSREPYFIIDGAHNPSGVAASIAAFKSYFDEYFDESSGEFKGLNALLIYGCFKDKPYDEMIKMLAEGLKGIDFLATEPDYGRALPAEDTAAVFEKYGAKCRVVKDEREAYEVGKSGGYDVVFCIGSIYLIGDMRIFYKTKGWN